MKRLVDEYMTLTRAAAELGVHRSTMSGYVRDGKIRLRKIGRRYFVTMADLRAFIGRGKDG